MIINACIECPNCEEEIELKVNIVDPELIEVKTYCSNCNKTIMATGYIDVILYPEITNK